MKQSQVTILFFFSYTLQPISTIVGQLWTHSQPSDSVTAPLQRPRAKISRIDSSIQRFQSQLRISRLSSLDLLTHLHSIRTELEGQPGLGTNYGKFRRGHQLPLKSSCSRIRLNTTYCLDWLFPPLLHIPMHIFIDIGPSQSGPFIG